MNQAERDLDDAKFNLSGGRCNVACFLAQKADEKALKAHLLSKDFDDVCGHSITELCDDAVRLDDRFRELRKTDTLLDKYRIPTRYPDALPGGIPSEVFDENDAQKAIESANTVINFVMRLLPQA